MAAAAMLLLGLFLLAPQPSTVEVENILADGEYIEHEQPVTEKNTEQELINSVDEFSSKMYAALISEEKETIDEDILEEQIEPRAEQTFEPQTTNKDRSLQKQPSGKPQTQSLEDAKLSQQHVMLAAQTPSKTKKSTAITMNIGGGTSTLLSNTTSSLPINYVANELIGSDGLEVSFMDLYESGEVNHRQPFSFALNLTRGIAQNLNLTTGLSYTMLASDIMMDYGQSESVQRLQFLGVPLRLDYNILDRNKFTVYLGAGMSVEYCISSKLDNKVLDENRWHYSLNSVIGASYKINNTLGLYLEPDLSYYLTKTKSKSIRNDNPVNLTMRMGIRFTL